MTQKNRTLEGKNRTLGGEGGVKNRRKSSDIIYVRSLTIFPLIVDVVTVRIMAIPV